MSEPTPSPVDRFAALEARLAKLLAPERAGHPDNVRDFQADVGSPASVELLRQELALFAGLEAGQASPDECERVVRIEDCAMRMFLIADIAKLPSAGAFVAVMNAAADTRRRLRPDVVDPRRDIPVCLRTQDGHEIDLPTRPGPFTIGGPGADVALPGEVGILAVAEVQPNGALRITKVDAARTADVGRNEPCPCGSGRKHKRCCLH